MTTVVLPQYVTIKNDDFTLTVSTDQGGILTFVGQHGHAPTTAVFEVVNIPNKFQTVSLKSCATGMFWKRSAGDPDWINADAEDVDTSDSFQYETQDDSNTLFAFWSPKDSMFLRRYTLGSHLNRLCAFSRPADGGGVDAFTRFIVERAEKP